MKYEKAEAIKTYFENTDIVTESLDCGFAQFDTDYCTEGSTKQSVNKDL